MTSFANYKDISSNSIFFYQLKHNLKGCIGRCRDSNHCKGQLENLSQKVSELGRKVRFNPSKEFDDAFLEKLKESNTFTYEKPEDSAEALFALVYELLYQSCKRDIGTELLHELSSIFGDFEQLLDSCGNSTASYVEQEDESTVNALESSNIALKPFIKLVNKVVAIEKDEENNLKLLRKRLEELNENDIFEYYLSSFIYSYQDLKASTIKKVKNKKSSGVFYLLLLYVIERGFNLAKNKTQVLMEFLKEKKNNNLFLFYTHMRVKNLYIEKLDPLVKNPIFSKLLIALIVSYLLYSLLSDDDRVDEYNGAALQLIFFISIFQSVGRLLKYTKEIFQRFMKDEQFQERVKTFYSSWKELFSYRCKSSSLEIKELLDNLESLYSKLKAL